MKKYLIGILVIAFVFSLSNFAGAVGEPGTACTTGNGSQGTYGGGQFVGQCWNGISPAQVTSLKTSNVPAWVYQFFDWNLIPSLTDSVIKSYIDAFVADVTGWGNGLPQVTMKLRDEALKRAFAGSTTLTKQYIQSLANNGTGRWFPLTHFLDGPAYWAQFTDDQLYFIYGPNHDNGEVYYFIEDRIRAAQPACSLERAAWDGGVVNNCPNGLELQLKAHFFNGPECWSGHVSGSGTYLCQAQVDVQVANNTVVNPPATPPPANPVHPEQHFNVPGCQAGFLFSSTTGDPCNGSSVPGCQPGFNYSPISGKECPSGDGSNGESVGGSFVDLTVDHTNVAVGQAVILKWTSSGLGNGSCSIKNQLGNLIGNSYMGTSNSAGVTTPVLTLGTHTFTITCDSSIEGYATDSATVHVGSTGVASLHLSTPAALVQAPPPSNEFQVGGIVSIKPNTSNVNVRATPSTSGSILGTQSYFSWGKITNIPTEPTIANGNTWWNVDFNTGVDGWISESFLIAGVTQDMLSRGITGDTSNQWGYNTNPNYDYDQACGDGKFPETVQVPGRGTAKTVWAPMPWDYSSTISNDYFQAFTCQIRSDAPGVPVTVYPMQLSYNTVPTRSVTEFNNSLTALIKYLGNGNYEIQRVFAGKYLEQGGNDVTVVPSNNPDTVRSCSGTFLGGGIGTPNPKTVTFKAAGVGNITVETCDYDCSKIGFGTGQGQPYYTLGGELTSAVRSGFACK